ncbi:GNAT family N-acetyltransferase [Flavobacteriaceae bacterium 3-367]
MRKLLSEILKQNCLFRTDRVSVLNWDFIASQTESENSVAESVLKIMTPNVTKALPKHWQDLNTIDKVRKWILERKADSNFYVITLTETSEIIGFLFLYVENETKKLNALRLGYLLAESIWGKGIGSELVKGFVAWCGDTKTIISVSGGVEKGNLGSIKVLEKNGFYKSNETLPDGTLLYKIDF